MWWYDVTCIKAPYTHYAYYKKRVIRIVNNVRYREHTDVLFLKSHALKFMDLVKYKTAEIMYEARNNLLPHNIQKKTVCSYHSEEYVYFNLWGKSVGWIGYRTQEKSKYKSIQKIDVQKNHF